MRKAFLRRVFYLMMALTFVCLAACSGGNLKMTGEEGEETGKEAASRETGESKVLVTAVQPYTRAMLDGIKVADASMTSDELRAICLEFAKMQCSIPWISSKEVKYPLETSFSDKNGNLVFPKETTYRGLPYTSAGSSIYTFMDYLDEETGVLDESVVSRVGGILGNNCSTSLFWAWSRVSSTITFTHTQVLVPVKGMIPIGPYTFDQSITSYKPLITKKICNDNGEQTMFQSYAKLLLGDGVVVNNQSDETLKGNHVRMCSILPEVVKNADGTIDGEASKVWFVEQDEVLRNDTADNGETVRWEGRIDSEYTFARLFKDGYIPFTIKEFLDPSSVQKAEATFAYENGAQVTVQELSEATISANYALSKLIVTVTGADGTEYPFSKYTSGVAVYSTNMATIATTMNRQLKAGSYSVTVEALVGSGETVPVFTGTLVRE